jgi:hypothetical protein
MEDRAAFDVQCDEDCPYCAEGFDCVEGCEEGEDEDEHP